MLYYQIKSIFLSLLKFGLQYILIVKAKKGTLGFAPSLYKAEVVTMEVN